MELSNNSLHLLEYMKSNFQGRPINKEDYSFIWLTTKGIELDVQNILDRKEEEKEKIKINLEIEELKTKLSKLEHLDKDYEEYKPEYEEYINLLHEYNEVKDAGVSISIIFQ
ncbi:hypothetical protein PIROE2DRAFT_5215 [Piromyces sp. E2]|nr:hypothetical protein PIROE2DRAFT_5215 [Piromyces sp. E2]|eukprot:OUM67354.1 hypothetical protein PIROE2DRAFT_5215 [Piromyces sp. E2]